MSPTALRYNCIACGFTYLPAFGDPTADIPPGTPFEALPPDWQCPLCGAEKDNFVAGNP